MNRIPAIVAQPHLGGEELRDAPEAGIDRVAEKVVSVVAVVKGIPCFFSSELIACKDFVSLGLALYLVNAAS